MRAHIITAALLLAAPVHAETLAGPYAAEIVRIIDGDTVEARVRIWLGLDQTIHIRIRDMDAPEMKGDCPEAAAASKEALARLLGSGPITLTNIKHDKYGGRVDAALRLPDGRDVGAEMLRSGHAVPWPRPKAVSSCPMPSFGKSR
jgi:endonuclease YncB( thermonuclease family)